MKQASAVCHERLILVLSHRQAERMLHGDAPLIQKDRHKTFEALRHEHDFLITKIARNYELQSDPPKQAIDCSIWLILTNQFVKFWTIVTRR